MYIKHTNAAYLLRDSYVDILAICETEIDNSFPNGQFLHIGGFSTLFRLDRNKTNSGITNNNK